MVNPTHLVAIGGIIGAILRYYVSQAAEVELFPFGTLTVNVIGSFVLGWVTFLGLGNDALLFIGTGACGSFTTFSSFSVGVVQLWEEGEHLVSAGYAAANLLGALVAIGIAWVVAQGF